jgi:hypothetical protein
VLDEWAKGSLIADGWIQEKPCRVTIDTGASATVARPDVVAGLPERELSQPYVLQTVLQTCMVSEPGSSVSIVSDYGLEDRAIEV